MAKHPFEQFNLESSLTDAVKDLNFKKPTEIQNRIIPRILKRTNLAGQSQTGTEESHAFLLPLMQLIDSEIKEPQAITAALARKLIQQLYDAANHLSQFKASASVKVSIGGADIEKDRRRCNAQPQLIVGTPTRINDLAKTGHLHMHLASYLIIDEADLMIGLGLIEGVDYIVTRLEDNANVAVFSATIPEQLQPFLNKYLSHPEYVAIDSKRQNEKNIEFFLMPAKGTARVKEALNLISILNPYLCIVFCSSKGNANDLARSLNGAGIKVGMVHGDLTPRERKQQMKRIRNLELQYVITSDLASRGTDIEGVSRVINFDVPNNVNFFIHRVGRTGRGNYKGVAIALYSPDEEHNVSLIEDRGFVFNTVDIKNGKLKEVKAHNQRQARMRKDDYLTNQVKSKVRSKTRNKVKPGYKKKSKQEVEKMKRQERKQFSKQQSRQRREQDKKG